ncbi:dTDP-4-dehydrorhamnose 3,5-epimerase [Chryseotalea sanaruensis]|uniref:dTDP-4-dehydrorhamnose 3,5-epimerase n=1 Tax=Chryseotalea sanaruensis TaxID=2482724 RepID=A0A401UAP8_9BACT|nr:dTDP-4-dehydrorhamnose 3,5-epimerase [Chryseotalea sanaruensis]GCC51986.1 dTDP-4-dehydrorhamnose 3,5-epimerase [Chryseotalea sanaruensis]
MHPNVSFIETGIAGLIQIEPKLFLDERGYFLESYRDDWLINIDPDIQFVQENQSFSKKGVIRGLHFQLPPFAQAKLVRVISGKVLDVVVDLRRDSATFAKTYSLVLDSEKQNQLFVPEGFAHGLAALEDSIFFYKCSKVYNKEFERGLLWNDPDLKIKWPFDEPIISEKDTYLHTLQELIRNSVI